MQQQQTNYTRQQSTWSCMQLQLLQQVQQQEYFLLRRSWQQHQAFLLPLLAAA